MAVSGPPILEDPGPDYVLNSYLIKIAREITNDDLCEMKYLLHGDKGSSRRVLEKISTTLSLFTHLRSRCLLSSDNILFLQGMLYQARRIDLVNMLREYGRTRGNILHCYPDTDIVEGYAAVRFHINGGPFHRNELEKIRSMASLYLGTPEHSVLVAGVALTESYLVTFFIPVGFEDVLLSLDTTEQKSFLSLGVDFIIVNDNKIHMKESPDSDVAIQGIKLNEELDHCFQQTKSLQRQVEQYQLKEKTAERIDSFASFEKMRSLTIISTLLFNILQQRKNTTLDYITHDSINIRFKHIMQKVKSLSYDAEIIEELLDVNNLFARRNHLGEHRLLIFQQHYLIQHLQHSIRIARWERDRLKYVLGMNLKDPVLSEQEILLPQFTHIQHTQQIQVKVGIGINGEQLKPFLEEMSSHLTDDDKDRLRGAFKLRRQDEKMLKKEHDLCFIEILLNIDPQETEGINLGSFEQKLFKVVDREDFKDKWRGKMTEFFKEQATKSKHADEFLREQATKEKHADEFFGEQATETKPADEFFGEQATEAKHEYKTPHHKTDSETNDNGGNAKLDEVLKMAGLMMRQMINIENRIKNPLANLDI